MEYQGEARRLSVRDLDRLLELLALEEGPYAELSPATINSYIRGQAGAEEQALVESAMAASSAVREEVLALSAIAKHGEAFAALQAPPAPPRRRGPPQHPSGPQRPWVPRRPAVLATCGLLALGLLWVMSPLPPSLPKESAPLYAVSLDRRLTDEQFERGPERTADGAEPLTTARSPRDAALLSLFQAIEWKDGEFLVHSIPATTGGQRSYDLGLVLHRGEVSVPWAYHALLPQGAKEPQTAILVFPDLLLYWVESNTWTGRADLSQDPGQSLFLTVAYRLGDRGYRASAPTRIPPP